MFDLGCQNSDNSDRIFNLSFIKLFKVPSGDLQMHLETKVR